MNNVPLPPHHPLSTQLGPLRNVPGTAEIAGSLSAGGLVLILSLCLSLYGASMFQSTPNKMGVKTLSGRPIPRDPLQTSEGWVEWGGAGWAGGGRA